MGKRAVLIVALALALSLLRPSIAATPTRAFAAEQNKTHNVKVEKGYTPESAKRLARQLALRIDWYSKSQFKCLNSLWYAESRWLYNADNQYSTAYGIAQVLNTPQHLTPKQQIKRGYRYIASRYGNPCAAWKHFQKHSWY